MPAFKSGQLEDSWHQVPLLKGARKVVEKPLLLTFVAALGLMVAMLFDSGTMYGNVAPEHLVRLHNLPVMTSARYVEYWGKEQPSLGYVLLDVVVGHQELKAQRFEVIDTPGEDHFVLGFQGCTEACFSLGGPRSSQVAPSFTAVKMGLISQHGFCLQGRAWRIRLRPITG